MAPVESLLVFKYRSKLCLLKYDFDFYNYFEIKNIDQDSSSADLSLNLLYQANYFLRLS